MPALIFIFGHSVDVLKWCLECQGWFSSVFSFSTRRSIFRLLGVVSVLPCRVSCMPPVKCFPVCLLQPVAEDSYVWPPASVLAIRLNHSGLLPPILVFSKRRSTPCFVSFLSPTDGYTPRRVHSLETGVLFARPPAFGSSAAKFVPFAPF